MTVRSRLDARRAAITPGTVARPVGSFCWIVYACRAYGLLRLLALPLSLPFDRSPMTVPPTVWSPAQLPPLYAIGTADCRTEATPRRFRHTGHSVRDTDTRDWAHCLSVPALAPGTVWRTLELGRTIDGRWIWIRKPQTATQIGRLAVCWRRRWRTPGGLQHPGRAARPSNRCGRRRAGDCQASRRALGSTRGACILAGRGAQSFGSGGRRGAQSVGRTGGGHWRQDHPRRLCLHRPDQRPRLDQRPRRWTQGAGAGPGLERRDRVHRKRARDCRFPARLRRLRAQGLRHHLRHQLWLHGLHAGGGQVLSKRQVRPLLGL